MNSTRHISTGQWCRRYISFSLVGVVGILVFILFFTDNSIGTTYKYESEILQLKTAIKAERDTLEIYRKLGRSLASDPVTMERVAREHYHMQRPSEDVFLFQ